MALQIFLFIKYRHITLRQQISPHTNLLVIFALHKKKIEYHQCFISSLLVYFVIVIDGNQTITILSQAYYEFALLYSINIESSQNEYNYPLMLTAIIKYKKELQFIYRNLYANMKYAAIFNICNTIIDKIHKLQQNNAILIDVVMPFLMIYRMYCYRPQN